MREDTGRDKRSLYSHHITWSYSLTHPLTRAIGQEVVHSGSMQGQGHRGVVLGAGLPYHEGRAQLQLTHAAIRTLQLHARKAMQWQQVMRDRHDDD